MAASCLIPIGDAQRRIEVTPQGPINPPRKRGPFKLDSAIVKALTKQGIEVIDVFQYAHSLGSKTAQLVAATVDQTQNNYFLKIVSGSSGREKCKAEYESLKAICAVLPAFAPTPLMWGQCEDVDSPSYFLLEEFREIASSPAAPNHLARELAYLHTQSQSPTDKFGFHIRTWHGEVVQDVAQWDDSWAALFGRHLGQVLSMARSKMQSPKFDAVCDLTLNKVVPRLLLPLQENGRLLKPSLLHGDCWDGNTAVDATNGDTFIFDVCSFYGHNEYDVANWRAPRHRLSDAAYIKAYKDLVPASEPREDWGARNLLYSLFFNTGNFINIPGSEEAEVVFEDMTTLCSMFCPDELMAAL